MIKAKFKFHPVGQGAFYTGKVFQSKRKNAKIKGKEFNIVYDCGTKSTKSYLIDSIKEFKKDLDEAKLDVLILSHLDEDHINGVTELLKDIDKKRRFHLNILTDSMKMGIIDEFPLLV